MHPLIEAIHDIFSVCDAIHISASPSDFLPCEYRGIILLKLTVRKINALTNEI